MNFKRRCVGVAAALCCHLACVTASAASDPQPVDEGQIPSLEQLRHRFRLHAEQVKPGFTQNMTLLSRHRVAALEGLGCQEELTLAAGAEFEPGKLDGAITLFACENGSYGVFEVHVANRSATQARGLREAPAAGRHIVTATGRSGYTATWRDASGAIFSMSLMDPALSQASGRVAAAEFYERAGEIAARLGHPGSVGKDTP